MRDDAERLKDILEAIAAIERYRNRGKDDFLRDELLQVWMVHHLQIIGEAASRVSDGLRQAHPELPWEQMVAMRNLLVHQYFGVDSEETWSTVERDVPDLKRRAEVLLAALENGESA